MNARATQNTQASSNLLRSCEACRTSKIRCEPDSDGQSPCQRCLKRGTECIFAEVKSRAKRPKRAKTITDIENKIDGLTAQLAASDYVSRNLLTAAPLLLPTFTPALPLPTKSSEVAPDFRIPRDPQILSPTRVSIRSSSKPGDFVQHDVISRGIITYQEAELLLVIFKSRSMQFPFVVVPIDAKVERLRNEKPFLLLAILAMASQANHRLQCRLEEELRESLSRRVIVEGEKSLDILQGLLVYLAWYHYYFKPDRQQIYQLLQMAIAMSVDLELARHSKSTNFGGDVQIGSPRQVYSSAESQRSLPYNGTTTTLMEIKRTYVACYYISSCLSIAFRKPNSMRCSSHIIACCMALAAANEEPSDFLIVHFTNLQQLADEINSMFGYDELDTLLALGVTKTALSVKNFESRLATIKSSLPLGLENLTSLQQSYHRMQIYIYEVALYANDCQSDGSGIGWNSSAERTEIYIKCLGATKEYLDLYMAMSLDEIRKDTIIGTAQCMYAIIVLPRLVLGADSVGLDVDYIRKTANVPEYLDSFILWLGNLITFSPSGEENKCMFWHYRYVLRKTILWYEQKLQNSIAAPRSNETGSKGSDLDPLQHLQALEEFEKFDSLPDLEMFSAKDLWASAVADWPNTLDGLS